jgi:alpha-D-ribose 1-methylphosphonate 5-triphosphate synthase subunit PhnH
MSAMTAAQPIPDQRDRFVPIVFQLLAIAMHHPGQKINLGMCGDFPPPLNMASAAIALSVLSREAPVWTDIGARSRAPMWLQVKTGAALVTEPSMARLALITSPARMPRLNRFFFGDDHRPERSTLVVIQVKGYSRPGAHTLLAADGRRVKISPDGLPDHFWADWAGQTRFSPLGVDVVFTCGDELVALPRELRVARSGRLARELAPTA